MASLPTRPRSRRRSGRRGTRRPLGGRTWLALAALLVMAAAADAATYDGYALLAGGDLGGATATFDVTGGQVAGTLSLSVRQSAAAVSYQITGRQRRNRIVVSGTNEGGSRLRWKGVQRSTAFSGRFRVKGPAARLRGRLVLETRPSRSACDDFFRTEVMGHVLLPICATCHRAGGLARGTRLQVLADDAGATRNAVAALIDPTDPPASLLLQKPTGGLNHGGGAQLTRDGPEMLVLQQWVDLASQPECGGGGPPLPDDPGTALYLTTCAGCHGTQGQGAGGRPAIRCNRDVSDAVKQGRPGPTADASMPAFPLLTDADIVLIQGFLDGLCPAETATGAALFSANCGSCHGADALGDSGPAIRCSRSIRFAVQNGIVGAFPGYMPPLLRLDDAEIQKIQDHLVGLCPLPAASGADLFGANCAACHGTTGAGDHGRPDVRCTVPSRLHHALYYGRGFPVAVMPGFTPALGVAEEAKIATFLAPLCSNQGAALFASNCATCHGASGGGGRNANGIAGPGIRCADSAEVYDAVTDGSGGMPAIGDLSAARIDAIVAFLRTGCR